MPERSSKRPRDVNSLAARLVRESVGDERVTPPPAEDIGDKNPSAVALGRLGGRKGGKARAEKLSAEERSMIAKKAAAERWSRNEAQSWTLSTPTQGSNSFREPLNGDSGSTREIFWGKPVVFGVNSDCLGK
jgi:hypothetical protein